jgi:protein-disulfide isomerase
LPLKHKPSCTDCYTRHRTEASKPTIENEDVADVKANGVRQTPTFFVNGKPLTEFSPQGLYNLVGAELNVPLAGS